MPAKIDFFDIESSNLNADFGFILSGAVKSLGNSKTYVSKLDDYKSYKSDPTNDKYLVKDLADRLSESDVWVSWYGAGFDVPYINSRLIFHGYDPLPPIPHIDLWRISRYQLKLHSNRLASAASFLQVEEKTKLDGPIWIRASAGHGPSLKYVVEHNVQDVLVLEQAYEKMKPLIMNGPHVGIIMGGDRTSCPICGGDRVKKGLRVTHTGSKQRLKCNKCGGWSTESVKKEKKVK